MWHNGHGNSDTAGVSVSGSGSQLTAELSTAAVTLRWVSTAPLAGPVVPEV